MSRTTPAADLARLKVTYRDWVISRTDRRSGALWTATSRTNSKTVIRTRSAACLEQQLMRADWADTHRRET
jgi:hypothetical protein